MAIVVISGEDGVDFFEHVGTVLYLAISDTELRAVPHDAISDC